MKKCARYDLNRVPPSRALAGYFPLCEDRLRSRMERKCCEVAVVDCGTRTDRGGWMKPTFALLASGPIYIERWTGQATRSISCSLRSAMPRLPSASSRRHYGRQTILVRRVINVDGNPAYPTAIEELKGTRELGRRCRCRPVRYLNNIVEQDHRAIERRIRAMQGIRSFHSAARTIQGIKTVNMIRKGQIFWCQRATFSNRLRSYQTCSQSQSPPDDCIHGLLPCSVASLQHSRWAGCAIVTTGLKRRETRNEF